MVYAPHQKLMIDASKMVFMTRNIDVSDEMSPRGLLKLVNNWVFTAGRLTWEHMANEPLRSPRYYNGFCHSRSCPNAAFVSFLCNRCCKVRLGVEVWASDVSNSGQSQLGLFACKDFKGGDYVCNWTWYIEPIPTTDRTNPLTIPTDRYFLAAESEEDEIIIADARTMVGGNGKTALAGPGRYVGSAPRKSNVIFVPKEDRLWTWGFKVGPNLAIKKGEEIFRENAM